MARKLLFVIKDEKVGGYSPLNEALNKMDLLRILDMTVKSSPQLMLVKYPADYSVWIVAEWDNQSGQIFPLFEMEYLCHFTQVVGVAEEETKNESK